MSIDVKDASGKVIKTISGATILRLNAALKRRRRTVTSVSARLPLVAPALLPMRAPPRRSSALGLGHGERRSAILLRHWSQAVLAFCGGQSRRYIFYVDTSEILRYSYRTCVIYGACSWAAPSLFSGAAVNESPTTAQFDGKLWSFYYEWFLGDVRTRSMNADGTLNAETILGDDTDAALASASFNGKLYFFYKALGAFAKPIKYRSYTVAGGWTAATSSPSSTHEGLDATVVPSPNYTVAVAYLDFFTNKVAIRRMFTDESWGAEYFIPGSVGTVAPSIEYYRGRLHVAATQASSNKAYYASCLLPCTTDASWTAWAPQDGSFGNYVHLDQDGAADGRLYLWPRLSGTSSLYWRWKNSE